MTTKSRAQSYKKTELKFPVSTPMYIFIVPFDHILLFLLLDSFVFLVFEYMHEYEHMHVYGRVSQTDIQSTVVPGKSSEYLILRQKERFPLT